MTCLYEGIPASGLWSQFEALGMSIEMPSGVLVAEMVDGMKFALGAVMAVRRSAVEAIGGIRETAYFYSDDFVLGNRIAEAGYEVVLSHYQVGHVLAEPITAANPRRSIALDEEHPLLPSAGTCRVGPHLCGSVRIAGAVVGLGPQPSSARLVSSCSRLAWLNRMLLALVVGWGIMATAALCGCAGSIRCATCWASGCGPRASPARHFSGGARPISSAPKAELHPSNVRLRLLAPGLPQGHD